MARERAGQPVQFTYEANPGRSGKRRILDRLSWQIDSRGQLGIRKHFESPYRPGEKITIDEYYRFIFERVPGLAEAAKAKGLDPLAYMRKSCLRGGEVQLSASRLRPEQRRPGGDGRSIQSPRSSSRVARRLASRSDGICVEGFPTPSRSRSFYSQTLVDWNWPEYAVPQVTSTAMSTGGISTYARRILFVANFSVADHDPHPQRRRQVAQRDFPVQSPVGLPGGWQASGAGRW